MDAKILIIDDEKSIRTGLRMILGDKYRVLTAKQGDEALSLFHSEQPDIILLDIGLQGMDGLQLLKGMRENNPDAKVIMITAVEEVKTIVKAIKLGAYDYLVKPINAQELLLAIQNALENKKLINQIRSIQQPSVERYKFDLIGNSPKIKTIIETAKKVANSIDTPLLITGESGAGKGVLAKATHYNSREVPGPFVTVNCGAIAKDLVESELFGYERGAFTGARADGKKGRFEEAVGGTLFLDEIGAMPISAQVKLLAVLEDRTFYRIGGSQPIKVSARIIAVTNTDLERAVEQGRFRKDLFFRLNVVRIDMPPLRERAEDIILLTKHFMAQYNHKFGKNFVEISSKAQAFLLTYHWPGNVRELRNAIERIILIEDGNILIPEHFRFMRMRKEQMADGNKYELAGHGLDYNEVMKSLINEALKITQGNVSEAARIMNMPSHKLRYRIKKYGFINQ